MYDITNPDSFRRAKMHVTKDLQVITPHPSSLPLTACQMVDMSNAMMALVGNKIDLADDPATPRMVPQDVRWCIMVA